MNIGIAGLGLIGGSFAKAIKEHTPHTVLGYDLSEQVMLKALMLRAADERLTPENLTRCDLLLVALYPQDTISYIRGVAPHIKKGATVMDCSGVKEIIHTAVDPLAEEYGFHFVGGHPMAGIEYSGFEYAKQALFNNASMILTPSEHPSIEAIESLKELCLSLGFSHIQITTPQKHDQMIALTSQLAHVLSSAYVMSDSALLHQGFSAGSFKDMTRVARLNETMWAELFIENRANLTAEIDGLIHRLGELKDLIASGDPEPLRARLKIGSDRKKMLDGGEKKRV